MENFLEETKDAIEASGHEPADIIFIGSEASGHSCTWEEFEELANIEYDSGYGGQNIAKDLIVVFSDNVKMWRDEYDGAENWAYSTPFTMPAQKHPITTFFNGDPWASLAEMHKPGGKYGGEEE